MMLMIGPVLIMTSVALSLVVLAWRTPSERVATRLLWVASAIGAGALWLFCDVAWAFRDGFPIAAPDHASVESEGAEALGRFWAQARYGVAGALAGLGLVAGCWRHRSRGLRRDRL